MNPQAPGIEVVTVHYRHGVTAEKPRIQYKIPMHGITLFVQGGAAIRQGGVEFPAVRPLFWYLPKDTEASEHIFAGPFHNMFATFLLPGLVVTPEGKARLRVNWNGNTVIVPRWKIPDAGAVTRVVELFTRLKKAWETPRVASSIRAASLMLEIFQMFLELPEGQENQMGHRALARVQHLLQSKTSADISLGELARGAGVSEGYLRRLFRQRIGLSPVKYRNNLRIARARDILLSTDVSVKEAAARVGFDDPLYFSRIFRNHFGVSPRELIRRHRLPQVGRT